MVNSSCEFRTRSCRSTRLQRNLAEKQRRYKLNSYISELANIVPMVSMSSKRLDKTSILRLSAAHLRIYQSPIIGHHKHSVKPYFKWRPSFLDANNIWKVLEAIDGFLLLTNGSGKVVYISQSVERFLGHQHIEMIGHSILSFIHPADVEAVQNQLQKLVVTTNEKNGKTNSERCSFYCRIRERCQPRSEVVTYQLIHVVGHMTLTTDKKEETENNSIFDQMNCLFKAFVRVVHTNPCNELSLTDSIEDEYVTRHSLDGTIIFADHRLSTITGHLPHEVFGKSAYHYIIADDVPVALFAHKLMFANNVGRGLIVYRLRTSNHGRVYLKTSGYLQYDKSSSKIDHFVCVNKLVSDDDGEEELKNFIECFTPHIHSTTVHSMFESICSVQTSGMAHLNDRSDEENLSSPNGYLTNEESPIDITDVKTSNQLNLIQCKDHSLNNNKSVYYSKMHTNGTNGKHSLSICNNDYKKHSNTVINISNDVATITTDCFRSTNRTISTISTANSHELRSNSRSEKRKYSYSECSSEEYESSLSDDYEIQLTKQIAKTKQLSTINCSDLYSSNQIAIKTLPQLNSSLSLNGITGNQYNNDSTNSSDNFLSSEVFKEKLSTEPNIRETPDLRLAMKSWFSVNGSSVTNCSHNGGLLENQSQLIQQKLEHSVFCSDNVSKSFANIFSTAVASSNGSYTSECSDLLSLRNNCDYMTSEL